jgi:hypothetical protein
MVYPMTVLSCNASKLHACKSQSNDDRSCDGGEAGVLELRNQLIYVRNLANH